MKKRLSCIMAGALLLTAVALYPIGKSQADEKNKIAHPQQKNAINKTEVTPVTPAVADINKVNQYITRAELAEKMVNSLNLNLNSFRFLKPPAVAEFYDDVKVEESYADAVMILVYNQVINSSDRFFRPSENILREELAEMIGNLLQHQPGKNLVESSGEPVIKDLAKANSKATDNIKLVVGQKIMNLNQEGNFQPKQGITSAEAQAILKNLEQLVGVNDTGVTAQIITNKEGSRALEISWGEKPSSGYKIFIVDMQLKEHTLIVKYDTKEPTPGSYNSTVITEPKDSKPIPASYPAQLTLQLQGV
ncbi:S-layer homology domain-containing protein [Desulforamulus aeronauticus]|uniref:S-layer homology domain-containing protein n=1 Tax=Desulforamulus aeronauticus DSM 10349 TaxID=1121421 RepID=A0A1M6PWE9_9FIRM|nr:S-layer homology domain-containing protein [Desulforamulus aeronauticus]SHK12239.1 S-layer homology domain-containing protein [Desulforamulus aeronauticus DSM 10349]